MSESFTEVYNRMVAKYALKYPEVDPVIMPDVQVQPVDFAPDVAEKAFVVEVPDCERMYITGRAGALIETAGMHGKAMTKVSGRYVGADKPNRNNALWSTGDLEFGYPSVAGGPANLLHKENQIVGAITDSKFVYDTASLGNHLTVDITLWKFLYPSAVAEIEHASAQGDLFLSMECIGEQVECAGADGCGSKFDYAPWMRDKSSGCEHLAKGGVRRIENPTFLGVGVLFGGVQPGWEDATASVQREASEMAEKNQIDRETAWMIADSILKWSQR